MHLATKKEFPYYPNRYFRRQVADWLVRNRQRVMLAKGSYLCQAYGIADLDATFPGPYSYRSTAAMCWTADFGGMQLSCMLCPVCGLLRSL